MNFFGTEQKDPDRLYCKHDAAGDKYYYDRVTNKTVPKRQIDPRIIAHIKPSFVSVQPPRENAACTGELINERTGYLVEIEKLQAKIHLLDILIESMPSIDPEEVRRAKMREAWKNRRRGRKQRIRASQKKKEEQENVKRQFEDFAQKFQHQ